MSGMRVYSSGMNTNQNVRVGNTSKVHMVTPAAHSGILNRAAAPTCGAYLGQRVPRTLTSEPVTCRKCQRAETYTAMFAEYAAL